MSKNARICISIFTLVAQGVPLAHTKLRRFLFFGTMEQYGTERNSTMSGTVQAQNERNGRRNGTVSTEKMMRSFL